MKPYKTVQDLYEDNYKNLLIELEKKMSQIEQYNMFIQGNRIL